jgi:uncharacterized protein (DUF486 family)
MVSSLLLLVASNVFMTIAWYGHLKSMGSKPLWIAIGVSWAIAFFEYCLQVPGNRIGFRHYSLPQLKILQEVITLCVFVVFARFYMGVKLSTNMVWAGLCLVGAVYFIFKDARPV